MAGLRLNYGTKQPPEYSNVPNADSVNGTKGTNTAGAKRNQAEQKPPPTDAWAQFGQAARGWGAPSPSPSPAPTAPAPAPTTPRMPAGAPTPPPGGMTPAQLAGVIRGNQATQGGGKAPSSAGGSAPSGSSAPSAPGPPPNQGAPSGTGVAQPFGRGPAFPPVTSPLPPPTMSGGPPGGAGKLTIAPGAPGGGTDMHVGNEGAGAQFGAMTFNPNLARRDQGDGTANPAPAGAPPSPTAPPLPPSTTSPTGTRAIGTDPNADPSTPAGIPPGRALGGTGSLTPGGAPGGQIGGAAGIPPPGTVRGSGGNLGGGHDMGMGPGAAGTPGAVRPEGWGDFETQKLNEYITAGYGFLKDNPDMLARYWADQGRTGEKGVDLPDWLAAQYPTIDWSQVPENARPGRKGYDTWRFTDANGTPRGFAPQSGPPGQSGNARGGPAQPWISNVPGAPTSGSPYGGDRAVQGQQDAAWQAAEDAKKKAAEQDAAAAPPGISTTPNANPNPNAPPTPVDDSGLGPPVSNANPNPTKQPPLHEGTPQFGPGAEGGPENYADRLLNPLHQHQQQELLRVLRQQGANEGTINSGAFGDVVGKAEGSLIAQQGAQKAQFISENENRALQKYGIDQGKIIAEMQDATQRFGIKTNADLERWLNSADSDTLQRYGIDKNDLLSRYKADLEASGQKYSADQQVNAARLQSGATRSAAGAAASAAMHDAQLRYQLGVQQLGQSGAQFGMQNQLDWAQLQAGLYNNDSNRQLGWATLASQLGMTPAQLAGILQGYQPPAPVYNAP